MKVQQQSSSLTLQAIPEFQSYASWIKSDLYGILRIKAPVQDEKDEEERVPVDVICCIDVSGSMSGSKIKLLKETMNFLIDQLKDEDRLGITTYSDMLGKVFPLTNLTKQGKEAAHQFCNNLQAGGMTNLSAGLFKALHMMEERKEKSEVSSILLMTDGIVNRGVTNADTLVDMIKGKSQQRAEGIYYGKDLTESYSINSFGYGSGHDVKWLKKISDNASGMYFDIKDSSVVGEAFVNCIAGLLSTVCSKVKVTLETCHDSTSITKVHTSFPCKEIVKGKKYEVSIYDLQSEEVKDIVLEMVMNKLDKPDPNFKLIKASATYKDHMLDTECTKNIVGFVQRLSEIKQQEPNKDVDEQRNRIEAQKAMQDAIRLSEEGKYQEGRERLEREVKRIKVSKSALQSEAYFQDLEEAQSKMTSSAWMGGGHAYAQNVSHGMQFQRSNALSKKAGLKFANKKRKSMMAKFSKA